MSNASILNSFSPLPVDLLASTDNRLSGKISAAKLAAAENKRSELKKVAQDFESVFIAHMLKVMRETIDESGLTDGGFGKSMYTELFDQEIAGDMARKGALGIGAIIYKSLERQVDAGTAEDASEIKPKSGLQSSGAEQKSEMETGESSEISTDIPDFQLPIHARISSQFGLRKDPFTGQAKFHRGIDLAAPEGMPVVAALPGKVIAARYESGYGNSVLIEHESGLRTRYGHLASINVKQGDMVTSEDVLGAVGSTGRSTGPHLHFEVTRMGKPEDPMVSLNASAAQVNSWKKNS